MTPGALRGDFAQIVHQAAQARGVELREQSWSELCRLQKASEDFEAMFVKGLLDVARRTTLAEKPSATADFALDMMNLGVAEAVSRRQPGLGIARAVFRPAAEALVAQAAPTPEPKEKP